MGFQDTPDQSHHLPVSNGPADALQQDFMVDAREIPAQVALEDVGKTAGKFRAAAHSGMGAFSFPASVAVLNELLLENRFLSARHRCASVDRSVDRLRGAAPDGNRSGGVLQNRHVSAPAALLSPCAACQATSTVARIASETAVTGSPLNRFSSFHKATRSRAASSAPSIPWPCVVRPREVTWA